MLTDLIDNNGMIFIDYLPVLRLSNETHSREEIDKVVEIGIKIMKKYPTKFILGNGKRI